MGARSQAWKFRLGAAYAWHNIDTDRTAAFTGFIDTDTATYHADTGQIFAEIGYSLGAGPLALEPYVGFSYLHAKTESFDETGGKAAHIGEERSTDLPYGTLGLTASLDQTTHSVAVFRKTCI
jgi:outer membrane autotransporter protein